MGCPSCARATSALHKNKTTHTHIQLFPSAVIGTSSLLAFLVGNSALILLATRLPHLNSSWMNFLPKQISDNRPKVVHDFFRKNRHLSVNYKRQAVAAFLINLIGEANWCLPGVEARMGKHCLDRQRHVPAFAGCMIYGWSSTTAPFVVANTGISFSIMEI